VTRRGAVRADVDVSVTGGAFSGNLLDAGARDFAFVHQSADDANEFYTVPLQMWNVCPTRAGEAPSLSVIGRRPFGEIPKINPKIQIQT